MCTVREPILIPTGWLLRLMRLMMSPKIRTHTLHRPFCAGDAAFTGTVGFPRDLPSKAKQILHGEGFYNTRLLCSARQNKAKIEKMCCRTSLITTALPQ